MNSWAFAMLYTIAGERRYRDNALCQMEFILASQHQDGFMMGPGVTCFEEQPIRVSYDWTADLCTWLVECAQEQSATPGESQTRSD